MGFADLFTAHRCKVSRAEWRRRGKFESRAPWCLRWRARNTAPAKLCSAADSAGSLAQDCNGVPCFGMYEATSSTEDSAAIPPPRLHWGWVLALSLVTGFLFYGVWLIVQSNWSRRARGKSIAFPMSIILCAAQVAFLFSAPDRYSHMIWAFGFIVTDNSSGVVAVCWLIAIVLRIVNLLILRGELNEPLSVEVPGWELSGLMTILFGPFYFQYHLRDYQGAILSRELRRGISQPPENRPQS